MRRTKRFTLRRIVLSLAIVAIAAPVAQAKPTPADRPDQVVIDEQPSIKLGSGEIPYLDRTTVTLAPGEIPYVVDGTVAPPTQDAPAAAADDGYDIGYGIVSSMVIILLLAVAGSVVAIRHNRRAKLSPA